MRRISPLLMPILLLAFTLPAHAGESWMKRSGDLQNTGNAGDDPALQPETVRDLEVERIISAGSVNATPIVTEDDLLITGNWEGHVYVIDLAAGYRRLLDIDTGSGRVLAPATNPVSQVTAEFGAYIGLQATPIVGTVRVASGERERRLYFGVNHGDRTLWCVNLDRVAADRDELTNHPGEGYFCDAPPGTTEPVWPRSLRPSTGRTAGNLNGPPTLSPDQTIRDPKTNELVTRDVIYVPSTGLECSNAEFWALDAYSGEIYWTFDPVPSTTGGGGIIWTTPAMSADRSKVYITTGDCVTGPHLGELAESLVALDASTGEVDWYHQRRVVDTMDMDIGNGPLVADVEGEDGCHVVVSSDKDGCIYGFPQERDVPEIGELGFDPIRTGQQRVLYRKCFVAGSLNGGFNASNPAMHGRLVMQQTAGYPVSHIGADDANAFAIDACTGEVAWASSSISNGRTDAAVASGMLFQLGVTRKPAGEAYMYKVVRELQVVAVDSGSSSSPEVLATVELPVQAALGGGGLAIAKGKIYAPMTTGVAIIGVRPGSNASPPKVQGLEIFAGPYPHPMSPAPGSLPIADPEHPYPLMIDKQLEALQN